MEGRKAWDAWVLAAYVAENWKFFHVAATYFNQAGYGSNGCHEGSQYVV